MIEIRGFEVYVDCEKELLAYEWKHYDIKWGKLLACSPFRDERRPSFAVNLENGSWIDSGSDNEEWRKGHFIKLLSWLRNETWEETEEYLLFEYCPSYTGEVDGLELSLNLEMDEAEPEPLEKELLKPFLFRHPYLEKKRGLKENVQRAFRIGFDPKSKAISIPWFNRDGELVNIKFRSVTGKQFWYIGGGQPIKNHVYGLHIVKIRGSKRVFVVESEIDAMTLWQHGFPAIALGGANMTAKQKELILQSGIEELIIATDNDNAGRRIARSIKDELNGYMVIFQLEIPEHAKDVNDLATEELLQVVSAPIEKTFDFSFLTA